MGLVLSRQTNEDKLIIADCADMVNGEFDK